MLAHVTFSMTRKLSSQYEHKYCKIDQVFTRKFLVPFGLIMALNMSRNV
jgi:hypothetical protein